ALRIPHADLLGIIEQTRINDLLHLWMTSDSLCHLLRILACAIHAQAHRGQPAREQPAFVRLQNISKKVPLRADLLNQPWIACERDTANQIAESGKIFGS